MVRTPVVSGADAIAALERPGFEQVRQRGSHVVMRRGASGCVVPMHPTVKVGTLVGLLRQAGVSIAEFVAALD